MCNWACAMLHTATTACIIPRRPPVCQVYTTIVYGGPAVSSEGFASCNTSAVSCAAAEHPSRHVASSMMPGSAVHRDPHAGAPAQPHGKSSLVRVRRVPRATLHDTRHVARRATRVTLQVTWGPGSINVWQIVTNSSVVWHAHTRTHARTHAHARSHAYTHARSLMLAPTHTHGHARTHARTITLARTLTRMQARTHNHARPHAQTQARPPART
jgi:hypothetical protein